MREAKPQCWICERRTREEREYRVSFRGRPYRVAGSPTIVTQWSNERPGEGLRQWRTWAIAVAETVDGRSCDVELLMEGSL